jgi:hypothetical protein
MSKYVPSTEEGDDLRNPAYEGEMGVFEGYGEYDYCQCDAPLKSEKEQRDGVCRECL